MDFKLGHYPDSGTIAKPPKSTYNRMTVGKVCLQKCPRKKFIPIMVRCA